MFRTQLFRSTTVSFTRISPLEYPMHCIVSTFGLLIVQHHTNFFFGKFLSFSQHSSACVFPKNPGRANNIAKFLAKSVPGCPNILEISLKAHSKLTWTSWLASLNLRQTHEDRWWYKQTSRCSTPTELHLSNLRKASSPFLYHALLFW